VNNPITNITYAVGGGATGAGITGLPSGTTGSYAGGVFTISGTPTAFGTFNYTVTTVGTCSPQPTALGTLIVNPDATITLTSAIGTDGQTICVNNAITNITYSVGGGGTSANVTGLPVGVTGSFAGGIFTITGTPSVSGTFNYTVTTSGSCVQTSSSGTITIDPAATVEAGSGQTVCANAAVTLGGSFGGSSTGAIWTTGGSGTFTPDATTLNAVYTPSASDVSTGSVTLILTSSGPCSAVADQMTITFNQLDDASFTYPSLAFCQNGTDPVSIITGLPGGTFSSTAGLVFVNTSTGAIDLSATADGTYLITYTTNGSCPNSSSQTITVNSIPTPQIDGTMTVCQGSTYNYSTTNINGHMYTWTISNGTPTSASSAIVDVTWGGVPSGTLYLTETIAAANCSASDSAVIVIHETPIAIASGDATVCHGTPITINASASTGTPPLYYTWDNSLGTGAVQNINPSATTVYTVTVSNADNCSSTDNVVVTVFTVPQFSMTSTNATCDDYTDGTATATILSATQPVTLLWSNGATVTNLTHLGVGVYYLTLTDGTGCATIDSVVVESLDQFNCLEIPTVFSPNGDGSNDVFEIKHINLYPEAKVEIYNRWGNLLYKSDNYANPSNWWDGTYNGKDVSMGAYVFILTLSSDMDPIQGVVSIVR
jgi:gliding motility-associated-like protein